MREYYAHKNHTESKGTYFYHIFPSIMQVRMCGNYPIYKVKITELDIPVPEDSKQFQYLGWIRNDDNRLSLIQCNFLLFNMQFTYGVQAEVDRGRGRIACLNIEEIEEIK